MDYRVIITEDAEADMDGFVYYLLFEKKNEQAAGKLMDDLVGDAQETIFEYSYRS